MSKTAAAAAAPLLVNQLERERCGGGKKGESKAAETDCSDGSTLAPLSVAFVLEALTLQSTYRHEEMKDCQRGIFCKETHRYLHEIQAKQASLVWQKEGCHRWKASVSAPVDSVIRPSLPGNDPEHCLIICLWLRLRPLSPSPPSPLLSLN